MRRLFLQRGLGLALLLGLVIAVTLSSMRYLRRPPVRVGVLHSLTGTMALSEAPVMRATQLAIEELNEAGGVLGRPVEAVVVDGGSDWPTFAREAERLLAEEKVSALFGCWTSSCRGSVRPVVERHRSLLFYPLQYEGLEESAHVVYTGATPNQQIIPALSWSVERFGPRVFLVGSDYLFPRAANALIRDHLQLLRGTVVGEEYLPLGTVQVEEVVRRISAVKPDFIFSTLNGGTNQAFFRALREAGVESKTTPTMSVSIAEPELRAMKSEWVAGDYAAWNYFQSLPSEANQAFVDRYKRRFGVDQVVGDPMEAAYLGVHLWARAVEAAGSAEPGVVRDALRARALFAPGGMVYVDPVNLHTWKTPRIGRIRPGGQFELVWSAPSPIRPVPFPVQRTREQWLEFAERVARGDDTRRSSAGGAP
ncbi:MAG TPA: urea ABC transporter substrate-binding protein [Myxococcaceae bacterium]|nr:urea ABC transporter substrate-binding protein [Myxococcaceae bacterium]